MLVSVSAFLKLGPPWKLRRGWCTSNRPSRMEQGRCWKWHVYEVSKSSFTSQPIQKVCCCFRIDFNFSQGSFRKSLFQVVDIWFVFGYSGWIAVRLIVLIAFISIKTCRCHTAERKDYEHFLKCLFSRITKPKPFKQEAGENIDTLSQVSSSSVSSVRSSQLDAEEAFIADAQLEAGKEKANDSGLTEEKLKELESQLAAEEDEDGRQHEWRQIDEVFPVCFQEKLCPARCKDWVPVGVTDSWTRAG